MFGFLIFLIFFIAFWGILTVGLWILGIWWPPLIGLEVNQPWHLFVLRFFAGYCYHNDLGAFWPAFGLILGLIGGITIITRILIEPRSTQITMQLIGTLAFVHFLFWVILRNSTKTLEDEPFSLDHTFFLYTGILFGCLLLENFGIFLLSRLYNQWRSHHISKSQAMKPDTAIIFSCPHCQAKYHSVVKYCSNCHQNCDETL